MTTYLIGYDLNRPRGADDYPRLIEAIKNCGTLWWHHLDSTWLVKTNSTAAQVRDYLRQFIDPGDELLILGLSGEASWAGFNANAADWLRQNLGARVSV